jgi:hypothetical protein
MYTVPTSPTIVLGHYLFKYLEMYVFYTNLSGKSMVNCLPKNPLFLLKPKTKPKQ